MATASINRLCNLGPREMVTTTSLKQLMTIEHRNTNSLRLCHHHESAPRAIASFPEALTYAWLLPRSMLTRSGLKIASDVRSNTKIIPLRKRVSFFCSDVSSTIRDQSEKITIALCY